jgi:hypothetical protein
MGAKLVADTLTDADRRWAMEMALAMYSDRYLETQLRQAPSLNTAIKLARKYGWGYHGKDCSIESGFFARTRGFDGLLVEIEGREGVITYRELAEYARQGAQQLSFPEVGRDR